MCKTRPKELHAIRPSNVEEDLGGDKSEPLDFEETSSVEYPLIGAGRTTSIAAGSV